MKELTLRAISGFVYIVILLTSLYFKESLVAIIGVMGFLSLFEFSKLIKLKSSIQYLIFFILYIGFSYLCFEENKPKAADNAIQILLVLTLFVNLILINDLFTEKTIPLFETKRFILTTFYVTGGFIFIYLIANNENDYTPLLLLGTFILIWVNDSGAYVVGKNFGKQKLFPSVSPKKTVEGFLGGLFFACISSYFISLYTNTLSFTSWLILAIIVSVFGTIGDLIESKFKRQAMVKDSGIIMPGHGGLLDRLDSLIFAAPFIYLFLRILSYVS